MSALATICASHSDKIWTPMDLAVPFHWTHIIATIPLNPKLQTVHRIDPKVTKSARYISFENNAFIRVVNYVLCNVIYIAEFQQKSRAIQTYFCPSVTEWPWGYERCTWSTTRLVPLSLGRVIRGEWYCG